MSITWVNIGKHKKTWLNIGKQARVNNVNIGKHEKTWVNIGKQVLKEINTSKQG